MDDSLLSPCFLCRVSLFSLVYLLVLLGVSSLFFLFLLVCFVSRFLCSVSCFLCVCFVLFLVSRFLYCLPVFFLLCLPVFFIVSPCFLCCFSSLSFNLPSYCLFLLISFLCVLWMRRCTSVCRVGPNAQPRTRELKIKDMLLFRGRVVDIYT